MQLSLQLESERQGTKLQYQVYAPCKVVMEEEFLVQFIDLVSGSIDMTNFLSFQFVLIINSILCKPTLNNDYMI